MAKTFKFSLVSPEKVLVSADVEEVIVPGSEGDFTVLPLHAPFISTLRPGILRIPGLDGDQSEVYIRGGLAEVNGESLTVLAEKAVALPDFKSGILSDEIKALEEDQATAIGEDAKIKTAERLQQLRTLGDNLSLSV
ncbi:MAG: ATP synthase F1 subunit epsilon [Hyphomicrobiales bacterium]|nr:ATP synthase F1 subunit epsilon [Hyphomicrobiales bacterium]